MLLRLCILGGVVLAMGACTTDLSSNLRKDADGYIAKGQYTQAFRNIRSQLNNEKERPAALAVFMNSPGAIEGLVAAFDARAKDFAHMTDAHGVSDDLQVASRAGLLTADVEGRLRNQLETAVASRVQRGDIAATFGADTTVFRSLLSEPSLTRVYESTLAHFKGSYSGQPRTQLKGLVQFISTNAAYGARFEKEMASLTFSITEINEILKPRYPAFAEAKLSEMIVLVMVTTEPSRRLLEVDVGAALDTYDAVEVVEDRTKAEAIAQIAELQYDERVTPQTTRTVTVGYHEADILYAALAMPKNASFLYDVVGGGTEIEWAYEVTVVVKGEAKRKLIRDRTSESGYQCVNPRIINVFGGVSQPSGWPNSQTSSYCEAGRQPSSAAEMRKRIINQVADAVRELATGSAF